MILNLTTFISISYALGLKDTNQQMLEPFRNLVKPFEIKTNNSIEWFHSKINKRIGKHQLIYLLIKSLKTLHSSNIIDINRIKQKQPISVQSKKEKEKDERIGFNELDERIENWFQNQSYGFRWTLRRLASKTSSIWRFWQLKWGLFDIGRVW